ncbi:MAG: A/G-specific adenine glycosylase [Methylotenera sp.]|nr:A/G-specific adenine glycosylase [Methylotenera sp.]MSQ00142.1 A/G-specific adenine glycosylase [Methylotenera sp.]
MSDFASRLITWQKIHGRHDLPWQNTADPYAIWVSEIMLQQTQVTAVIGYYSKFMQRFPDIATLANASQEDVLQHWSGLGYYSRARNLHHAAMHIIDSHHGLFPQDFDTIQTLPGIGRSTAAAIASFAFNQVQTILDGNVKRVLARHFLVEGWPSTTKVEKQLWQLAEQLLPKVDMVAYTQGLMDLGATICSRRKPKCSDCPLINTCAAYQQHRVDTLPTAKPRKAIPEKHTTMLILLHGDEVMLEKRPPTGIWGGLWSFPETEAKLDFDAVVLNQFDITALASKPLPALTHTFTHFKLHIQPQPLHVLKRPPNSCEPRLMWLNVEDAIGAAIATPIRKILQSLLKT